MSTGKLLGRLLKHGLLGLLLVVAAVLVVRQGLVPLATGAFGLEPATASLLRRSAIFLAMVAEVLHGTPCRFSDPARFSLAHGGKDRHPFPVPTAVLDHTIGVLRTAMQQARLGNQEKLAAIARLDAQARQLEAHAGGPSLDAYLDQERRQSHRYGGRSVFGWEPAPGEAARAPCPPARRRSTS